MMKPAVALLAILFCVGSARADDGDPKIQARAHFRAGTAFYEAGSYDRAIEEYEAAYKILPLPDLLFNIGQAHRLKGNSAIAIDYYRRFLDSKTTGPIADEARVHLRELQAKEPEAKSAPPPAAQPVRPEPPTPTPTPSLPPPEIQPPPPSSHAPTDLSQNVTTTAQRGPARPHRRWLWPVVIGGGVVVVGLAVGLGVGLTQTRYPTASFGEVMPR